MNLKQKSFVFVGLGGVLMLIVYVGLSRDYLRENTNRYLDERRHATEAAAKSIDDFFQRATRKLDTIARLPLLLNGLRTIMQETSSEIPTQDTLHYLVFESDIYTDGVYLVNEHGNIIWSEPRNQSIINSPYPPFQAAIKDTIRTEPTNNITFNVWEAPDGHSEILLTATLIDRGGDLAGYLIGAIPTDHDAIKNGFNSRANDSVHVQLVMDDGVVVASTDPARLLRQLAYREKVSNLDRTLPGGIVPDDPVHPDNLVIAFKRLGSAPWMITTDEDRTHAMRDITAWRNVLVLIGTLSMTLIMAGLFFTVRSFTRPVELLTEEARRIAAGDMEGRFTSHRSDEIGVLAKTLEDMKLRLKSSYDCVLQSEKMALMGQIVAGIAHELNNPLTIVKGHTELMLMKGVDEQHQQTLGRIHDGADRASKIVRNLLTFARQKRPERKLTDINNIVMKTIDLRAYELKVSNIELVTKLKPVLPSTQCDPHQLQQVLLNLIVNAEQAMLDANGKGQLTIRTALQDNMIQIAVEDNGPGISTDNMRRVFEPFFTTKPVGKGTGLGLAICQGIIAEHGGRMNVGSTPGQGATFTVELPVVTGVASEQPAHASKPAENQARTHKILVVDDEVHMRDLFMEILKADGHEVAAAVNGDEALKLVDRQPFDLVVSDIKMPEVDGPALYEELKKRNSPLVSRMLFVSGDLMNGLTLKFVESCGRPWIAKPFEVSVVRETVRRLLAS